MQFDANLIKIAWKLRKLMMFKDFKSFVKAVASFEYLMRF